MMVPRESRCPGCGLRMPPSDGGVNPTYFHATPECWSVFSEVLAVEFGNAVLFGQVHQLTVDTYAVQHAGGVHPDKSIDIHLSGLYLMLEKGVPPPDVSRFHRRLANTVSAWPHLPPPAERGSLTVFDVGLSDSAQEHAENVKRWARDVWNAWSPHHTAVATFISRHLAIDLHGP